MSGPYHYHSIILTHFSLAWRSPLLLLKDVGEVALAAVLAVVHGGHEDTSTALLKVSLYSWSESVGLH